MDGEDLARGAPALIGRDHDVETLLAFLRVPESMLMPSRYGVTVVHGEPGVGKTGLLDVLQHRAALRGCRVLRATGVHSEVNIGFAALTQLLDPARSLVHRLPRVQQAALWAVMGRSETPTGPPVAVAAAVSSLLEVVADDLVASRRPDGCPLLLLVDDLQWVDRASADALGEVARTVDAGRVRMIVAERTGSRTLFDTAEHARHQVRPLSEDAADQLLRTRFPSLGRAVRARVIDEAGGHPLALLELPRGLQQWQPTAGGALPTHLPLTHRLQSLFGERVTGLPRESRQWLLVAALDDGQRRVPGHEWSERVRLLAPAERAGLLHLDRNDRRAHFRHPLVRTTVVALSSSQERRRAHRTLAAGYDDLDPGAAWHLAAATTLPDEDVAVLLEGASTEARRRGDASGSVRALVRAAQLSTDPQQRARRFAAAAYQGAAVQGDLAQASDLLAQARAADLDAAGTLQAAVTTAHLLLNGAGDTHTAHQVLVGALEAAGPGAVDPSLRAEAVHTLCEVCLYAADPLLWPAFHAALRDLPLREFPVLSLWTRLMVDPARATPEALRDLDKALDSISAEVEASTVERIATAAVFVDRVPRVRSSLEGLVQQARHGEAVGSGILALMLLSHADFHTGDWTRCRAGSDEGLQLTERHGMGLLAWPLRYPQALVAAAVGDHEQVRTLTDRMRSWAIPRRVGAVELYAHHADALDALGRGDYQAAYRSARAVDPPGHFTPGVGQALWVAMDLVEAAVHSGRSSAAQAHVTAMRAQNLAALSPRLALLVAGSEAMASPELHTVLFDRALAVPGASQWPFELARIELCYGQRLRRDRSPARARLHLQAAREAFAALGATPWLARAEHELEATTPTRNHTRAMPALTAQEHRIATLAGTGMTNRQIAAQLLISPRTVGAHLHQVFTKLDVNSRAGLHHALSSRDAVTAPERSAR